MTTPSQRLHGGADASAAAPEAISPSSSSAQSAAAERILQSLRDELDGLDRTLLETLRQRLDCCCRIGQHKRDHAIAMMQPHASAWCRSGRRPLPPNTA